jgi:hypothetical protein
MFETSTYGDMRFILSYSDREFLKIPLKLQRSKPPPNSFTSVTQHVPCNLPARLANRERAP